MWDRKSFAHLGCLSVVIAMLMSGAQLRADAVSDAVTNYAGPVWAAPYNAADISPTTINLFGPANTPLAIVDTTSPFVFDPLDNGYDGSFALHVNFTGGVATSGSLLERYDPGSGLTTLYSSSTLRAFAPFNNVAGQYYYFAFQNGAKPNDIIGGYITGSDVKTFAVTVPEPGSAMVLAAVGALGVSGRKRRFRLSAV